jgi:hypothetical protein
MIAKDPDQIIIPDEPTKSPILSPSKERPYSCTPIEEEIAEMEGEVVKTEGLYPDPYLGI